MAKSNQSSNLPLFKSRLPIPKGFGNSKLKVVETTQENLKLLKIVKNKFVKSGPTVDMPNYATESNKISLPGDKENSHSKLKVLVKGEGTKLFDKSSQQTVDKVKPRNLVQCCAVVGKPRVPNLKLLNLKANRFRSKIPSPKHPIKANSSSSSSKLKDLNKLESKILCQNQPTFQRDLSVTVTISSKLEKPRAVCENLQSKKPENSVDDQTFEKVNFKVNETICETNPLNVTISCDYRHNISTLNTTFDSDSTKSSSDLQRPVLSATVKNSIESEIYNTQLGEFFTVSPKDKLSTTYEKAVGNSYGIDEDVESTLGDKNNTFTCDNHKMPNKLSDSELLQENNWTKIANLTINDNKSEQCASFVCNMTVALDKDLDKDMDTGRDKNMKNKSYVVDKVSADEITPALNSTFDLQTVDTLDVEISLQEKSLNEEIGNEYFIDPVTDVTIDTSQDGAERDPEEIDNFRFYPTVTKFPALFSLSPIIEEETNATGKIDENVNDFTSNEDSNLYETDFSKNRIATDESLGILNLEELDSCLLSNGSIHENSPSDNPLAHLIQRKTQLNNKSCTSSPQTSSPIINIEFTQLPGFSDWPSPVESKENVFYVEDSPNL